MPEIERVDLECTEGGSNKYYSVVTEEVAGGYTVTGYHAAIGQAPNISPKTKKPESLEVARGIAAKLVREKMKKYRPVGERAGGGFRAARAGEPRGPVVQRLLPADEATADNLVADDNYIAQEKYDGERRTIRVTPEGVTGFNMKGEAVALTEAVAQAVQGLLAVEPRGFLLDGEDFEDRFIGFDILEVGGDCVRTTAYDMRFGWLRQLIGEGAIGAVRLAETAEGERGKRALVDAVRARGGEGVVFKHRQSLYVPGKLKGPSAQFKLKFYATATVIAGERKRDKSSVELFLLEATGAETSVGFVTIPPNAAVPEPGTLVDVRYLYAYRGGSLYQPNYLRPRTDIDRDEAVMDQLKYKAEPQPARSTVRR